MGILEQTEAFERVVELVSERSECCGCAADHLQALASQCEEHWVGESGAGRGSLAAEVALYECWEEVVDEVWW